MQKKSEKYFYNSKTLRFEKLSVPLGFKLLKIIGILSAILVTILIVVVLAFRFIKSPKQMTMQKDMVVMTQRNQLLQKQIQDLNNQLAELETRDNEIYRSIFEAAPLADSIRTGTVHSNIDIDQYNYDNTGELLDELQKEAVAINHRIQIQNKSFDTLQQMIKSKEKMLASIPAIQPISNKNLDHIASGFGYRIDPIYKTPKMHTGLDFAAASGTPIYATADGVVVSCTFDDGGYGNHVIINHGYGYETLYGHMVRIKAQPRQQVKRGQIIGWVGSTGKSTGPHLHYEVIRNKSKIDPVHYFFNDLTAAEYEAVLKKAAISNQSFD